MKPQSSRGDNGGHCPRILVCEDESLLRRTLARDLERAGYAVVEAATGEEAQSLLSGSAIDLLITDVRLPGISGWDLVASTRNTLESLPIFVMSAYGLEGEARELQSRFACKFFDKPFPMAMMRSEVQKALRSRSGAERENSSNA